MLAHKALCEEGTTEASLCQGRGCWCHAAWFTATSGQARMSR